MFFWNPRVLWFTTFAALRRTALRHTAQVLQHTYSTRFNDYAPELYSFVADNYAPFHSRPVECTDCDASCSTVCSTTIAIS